MVNPFPIILAAAAGILLIQKKKSTDKAAAPIEEQIDLEYDDDAADLPPPAPEEVPGGGPPPILGSSSPCLGSMYGGRGRVNKSVLNLMSKSAKKVVTPPSGRYSWVDKNGTVHLFTPGITYLSPLGQVTAYKLALQIIGGPNRSTPSIMTRNILKKIMPQCNWDVDLWKSGLHEYMSKDQYNLWTSVWYLVKAATKQKKYRVGGKTPAKSLLGPADGGPGLLVGRGFLDMPEVAKIGKVDLDVGRRVELIAGDYRKSELPIPPMFHAEPLYAYVVSSMGGAPLVSIVDVFQDRDVTPHFSHRHGFYPGRMVRLHASGTTGIRRIFSAGVA